MTMMVPVRCFTCGRVVGQHWDTFRERTAGGEAGDDREQEDYRIDGVPVAQVGMRHVVQPREHHRIQCCWNRVGAAFHKKNRESKQCT